MFRLGLLASILTALASTYASAGVQLRVGVRPDSLKNCEQGHIGFALWNDDATQLRVRVFVSLTRDDSSRIGPIPLRTRLGPNELRKRALDFTVPARLAAGRYALEMVAVASDSSKSAAIASFVLLESACSAGDSPPAPASVLLDEMVAATGLDLATPTVRDTWGALRRRYDSRLP